VALLFADEDFPHEIVQALRGPGHDATTTREAGLANRGTPIPKSSGSPQPMVGQSLRGTGVTSYDSTWSSQAMRGSLCAPPILTSTARPSVSMPLSPLSKASRAV